MEIPLESERLEERTALYLCDQGTSDAILQLYSHCDADGLDLCSVEFHIHTSILARCGYFSMVMLSESRGLQKLRRHQGKLLFAIEMYPDVSVGEYLKCFRLLSHKFICTSDIVSVTQALQLIKVSAFLLFDDCIDACCDFLSGIDWTAEEAKKIEKAFSAIQLRLRPDLEYKLILAGDEKYKIKRLLEDVQKNACPGMLEYDYVDVGIKQCKRFWRTTHLPRLELEARENMYEEWFVACEELKQMPKEAQVEKWIKSFNQLLDNNIADTALQTITKDEELIQALASYMKEYWSTPCRRKIWEVRNIFIRIFEMAGKGILIRSGQPELFAISNVVLYQLFIKWSWIIRDFNFRLSVTTTFNSAFSRLLPIQQTEFLSTQWGTDEMVESCVYLWWSSIRSFNALLK